MNSVTCSKCGTPRLSELSETLKRPPCPQCGGTALNIGVSMVESLSVSTRCSAELIPGNQTRDWKQRWNQIQKELQSVSALRTEMMSGENVHAWVQQLFSFFIQTYHLKDALKDTAPSLSLSPSTIEKAISSDPRLALLADLANLDKHFKLTKPPRSGFEPSIKQVSGVDSTTGDGWYLSVKIEHGTAILDGLTIAADAVAAWQEKLSAWGIQ